MPTRLTPWIIGAAALGLIALAGCAGHPGQNASSSGGSAGHGGGYYQNDGPPDDQNVDLSRISDAVPRNAPSSKYGNPASYTALGHTYHVMKNAAGFTQTGRASWYGRQFHDKRTSSGEPYNMFRMTAAHKRLPLPTWVRVTNLDNGRHCIVKVNDRGPFHAGRIIDLSYVAARRLDIVGNGSAPVRIETVTPASMPEAGPAPATAPLRSAQNLEDRPAASPARTAPQPAATAHKPTQSPAPAATDYGGLFLQAGAFGSAANAQRQVRRLTQAGATQRTIVPPDDALRLYRVRIGPFASKNQRARSGRTLAERGFSIRDADR